VDGFDPKVCSAQEVYSAQKICLGVLTQMREDPTYCGPEPEDPSYLGNGGVPSGQRRLQAYEMGLTMCLICSV